MPKSGHNAICMWRSAPRGSSWSLSCLRKIPTNHWPHHKINSVKSGCRQSGHLLLCYGVWCAHLHLKHCMQELPGLYAACREVVTALQRAYAKVEAGQLQDHPKLAALKDVLTTVLAIQPVSVALPLACSTCIAAQHACQ